jgi:hypothetical protein
MSALYISIIGSLRLLTPISVFKVSVRLAYPAISVMFLQDGSYLYPQALNLKQPRRED